MNPQYSTQQPYYPPQMPQPIVQQPLVHQPLQVAPQPTRNCYIAMIHYLI